MSQGDQAIAFAESQIGKPYSVFPDGKNTFDCSLLTQESWASAGVHIGRTTFLQIMDGNEVREADLLPGDLVFPDIGHVQLYVGNREIIEAPHSGAEVRKVEMWGFWRARRVGDPATGNTPAVQTGLQLTSNPLSNLPVVKQIEWLSGHLTSSAFWKRIGFVALGLLIIGLGIAIMNRKQIEQQIKSGTKTAEIAAVA